MQFIFAIAAGLLFATIAQGTASAQTELCAVTATVDPIGAHGALAASYVATLYASSAKTVSGTLTFRSGDDWYSAPFSSQGLTATRVHFQRNSFGYDGNRFASQPIYVQFPDDVRLDLAYVSQVDGASCNPDTSDHIIGVGKTGNFAVEPVHKALSVLPSGATTQAATKTPAPGPLSCAAPFSHAFVADVTPPNYPESEKPLGAQSAMTIVALALDARGKMTDSWIWGSSGAAAFDNAALRSVRSATFVPEVAFCQNVPSVYLFQAEFEP